MSSQSGNISVILVTHNSEDVLPECLQALSRSTLADSLESIVVDNGSTSDPSATIGNSFSDTKIILNRSNRGFAAACNQGAAEASGQYLLFLNPDVVVDRDALEILRNTLADHPAAGLAGGRLRFENGDFQPTCREFPTAGNLVFSRGSVFSRLPGARDRSAYTLPDFEETTAVPATAATLALIRRETFDRMGGFDQRFFLYVEDTDLCYRLNMTGFQNMFVPAAGGVHRWGRGSTAGRATRLWHHHMSMWRYFLKHQANGFSLVILPVLLVANLIAGLLTGKGRPSP